ncbi:MAG: PDZ domain-containing protein [Candidatus Cloacimonetes bacterium]|nr:PDZ domain-containing protein [Candidatus Cloacimonadota bacterium]
MLLTRKLLFFIIFILSITILSAEGWLGITISEPTEDVLNTLGQKEPYGVQIDSIDEGSPAEKAGLQINDLILKVNGEKVYTSGQLKKMIRLMNVDSELKLVLLRDGKEKQIKMILEERVIEKVAYLGVMVEEPSDEKYEEMKTNYGLEIISVIKDSGAEKAGLKTSDVILKINEDKVYTAGQLSKMIAACKPQDKLDIQIWRNNKRENVVAVLGGKPVNQGSENKDFYFDFFDIPDKVTVIKYDADYDRLGLKLEDSKKGIIVKGIDEKSENDKCDLQVGDLIIQINETKVSNISQLDEVLSGILTGETVEITYMSNGKKKKTTLIAGAKSLDNKFDISIDDKGIRMIVNGEEKILFDEKSFPKIQEYLNNVDIEEIVDRIKDKLPDEKEIEIKLMKSQTNKEKL